MNPKSIIIEMLKWRYAVKKFDISKKLTDEKLAVLKEAFNLTPTSYGLQPIRMVVVKDKLLKQDLQKFAFDQPQISTSSHLLVVSAQTDFGEKDIDRFVDLNIEAMPDKKEHFMKYGELLKSRFKAKSKTEILQWAKDQAFIALGNLINTCAIEKIDACPMSGFEPQEFDRLLGLKEYGLTSVVLLPIGYRAKDDRHQFDPKVRRPLTEMVIDI